MPCSIRCQESAARPAAWIVCPAGKLAGFSLSSSFNADSADMKPRNARSRWKCSKVWRRSQFFRLLQTGVMPWRAPRSGASGRHSSREGVEVRQVAVLRPGRTRAYSPKTSPGSNVPRVTSRPRSPEDAHPAGADEIDPGPGGVLLKDCLAGGVVGLLPRGKPVVELPAREEPKQGVAGQIRPGHQGRSRHQGRRSGRRASHPAAGERAAEQGIAGPAAPRPSGRGFS